MPKELAVFEGKLGAVEKGEPVGCGTLKARALLLAGIRDNVPLTEVVAFGVLPAPCREREREAFVPAPLRAASSLLTRDTALLTKGLAVQGRDLVV